MQSSVNQIKTLNLASEDLLRDKLVNHMVVLGSLLSAIGYIFVLIRTLEFGWTARDIIQLFNLVVIILLAFYRRKVPMRYKAVILILLSLILGVIGFYTLGMLAGGVFFFPLAAVIAALFYSVQVVVTFVLSSILFICLIAIGFVSGQIKLPFVDLLLTSYTHWGVYILCVTLFFVVTCVTILNYRRAIGELIADVIHQRNDLEKSNKELQVALDEIKILKGILPLCSFCKKIRDDQGYWEQVDIYINKFSDAEISHSICPECMEKHYPEVCDDINEDKNSE